MSPVISKILDRLSDFGIWCGSAMYVGVCWLGAVFWLWSVSMLVILALSWFLQAAPLPFPKPPRSYWGKDPVGSWVLCQSGLEHSVFVINRGGTASYHYMECGKPLPPIEPYLLWSVHEDCIELMNAEGVLYYRMSPPGPRDRYFYRRIK